VGVVLNKRRPCINFGFLRSVLLEDSIRSLNKGWMFLGSSGSVEEVVGF
jgi:hypothetical protein